jgi:coatomer subunit beta'
MERIWAIACRKGSNRVALGFDEGSMMIKMGKEQPVASMDSSGKIIWARHTEIQMVNVKAATGEAVADGERLPLVVKELGNCEVRSSRAGDWLGVGGLLCNSQQQAFPPPPPEFHDAT